MLERLGQKELGTRLARAVRRAILLGKDLTPDLGGTGNTERFTDRVIESRADLTPLRVDLVALGESVQPRRSKHRARGS